MTDEHRGAVEKRWGRRYIVEFGGVLVLLLLARRLTWLALPHVDDERLRVIVALIPVAPLLLVAAVVVRHIRRVDEFLRAQILEAMAVAGGATTCAALSYTFLERTGFPICPWFGFGW